MNMFTSLAIIFCSIGIPFALICWIRYSMKNELSIFSNLDSDTAVFKSNKFTISKFMSNTMKNDGMRDLKNATSQFEIEKFDNIPLYFKASPLYMKSKD